MVDLHLYDICLWIVLAYSFLGWLVLAPAQINYGRLKNSLAGIDFNPKFGWFIF